MFPFFGNIFVIFRCKKPQYLILLTMINNNKKPKRYKYFSYCIVETMNKHHYSCIACNFVTFSSGNYNKHIATKKHIKCVKEFNQAKENEAANVKISEKVPVKHNKPLDHKDNMCEFCGKEYKTRGGLSKHVRKCSENPAFKSVNAAPVGAGNNTIAALMKENQNLVQQNKILTTNYITSLKEQSKEKDKMIEHLSKNPSNVTNNNTINNTVNNNNFNINVFLNEDCKNAMNLTDFVNSLKYKLEDLERFGRAGFVEGISKIMIEGLNDLDVTERPIHCTDTKRDSLYIKDNDEWHKDQGKLNFRRAIKHVAHNNMRKLPEWQDQNPGHKNPHNAKHKQYVKIVNEVSGGQNDEEDDRNFKKIIKRVAAEAIIDKEDAAK